MFDLPVKTGSGLAVSPANSCGKNTRILVLGLGNILLKDEGIGVHVAQKLQELSLPYNVEVVDGGTAGMDILLLQKDPYHLVVIDAVRAGKKPGTIYKARLNARRNSLAQIFSQTEQSKISLHQTGLIDALSIAEKLDCAPEKIAIIGVEPGEVDYGLELTEPVKQRVPEVIKIVLKEIDYDIHREQTYR